MSFHKGLIGKDIGGGTVGFDRYPYLKHSTAEPQDPGTEKTLGDYIARKVRHEAFDVVAKERQSMNFEQWWGLYCTQHNVVRGDYAMAIIAWSAALRHTA